MTDSIPGAWSALGEIRVPLCSHASHCARAFSCVYVRVGCTITKIVEFHGGCVRACSACECAHHQGGGCNVDHMFLSPYVSPMTDSIPGAWRARGEARVPLCRNECMHRTIRVFRCVKQHQLRACDLPSSGWGRSIPHRYTTMHSITLLAGQEMRRNMYRLYISANNTYQVL